MYNEAKKAQDEYIKAKNEYEQWLADQYHDTREYEIGKTAASILSDTVAAAQAKKFNPSQIDTSDKNDAHRLTKMRVKYALTKNPTLAKKCNLTRWRDM